MAPASKVSPDNIICIDLTDDDDDSQDHLKSVRKRLKNNTPNTASAAKKIKTEASSSAVAHTNDNEVVVLDAKEEAPVLCQPTATAASNGNEDLQVVGTIGRTLLPHARQDCIEHPYDDSLSFSNTECNKQVCDLCYCYVCDIKASECPTWLTHCNATDRGPMANFWKLSRKIAKEKKQSTAVTMAPFPPPGQHVPSYRLAASRRPRARTTGLARVPIARRVSAPKPPPPVIAAPPGFHMRYDCTARTFCSLVTSYNKSYCSKCFCFVCHLPASECRSWHSSLGGYSEQHCNATNKDPKWIRLRDGTMQETPRTHGPGPFAPDQAVAQKDDELTKCRKCGWYNRFAHKNFEFYRKNRAGTPSMDRDDKGKYDIHPVGPLDWCHACGRVASERDFEKVKSKPYTPKPGRDILLGTKKMPFRLKVSDPRQMKAYCSKWTENADKWTYDEAEMKQELFRHRFGERPTLEMICASIPILDEEKIPKDGAIKGFTNSEPMASEVEAVLLENKRDVATLVELCRYDPHFGLQRVAMGTNQLSGEIRASWDSATQKGCFSLQVYVKCSAGAHLPCSPSTITRFLGAWFGVSNLQLSEVCGRLRPGRYELPWEPHVSTRAPPFELGRSLASETQRSAKKLLKTRADGLKNALDAEHDTLALKSGTGSSVLGGICTNETDFSGTLKRYVRESLPDYVGVNSWNRKSLWYDCTLGVSNRHRVMQRRTSRKYEFAWNTKEDGLAYDTLFNKEDYALATTHLARDSQSIMERTSTLNGLLDNCENLGHAPAPFVEGLNVELLPFQSQTLQWAIERETIPGGIQSFWKTKLPMVEETGKDLYYDFVTGKLSPNKPKLVRGGIIADQMGLGKTVISLSLILSNPAPPLPASGSSVKTIDKTTAETTAECKPFWDPSLNSLSGDSPKRGSILSRGTLVVCNVSLVGQWIDEAKSKLKNPGLVYSYHGSNRKRDPNVLAHNSIVVTTYETLASDINYHKKKSSDGSSYCAPCEQVRWWRVICDESHVLRSSNNNKSKAVLSLVADNKWLVSGTPVNTSLVDLENQFRFLGLQETEEMIDIYRSSTCHHLSDKSANRSKVYVPRLGHFSFLMRSIMMRHSQKQEYSGTSTTLMSLPPKTERVIKVDFSCNDKKEYKALEEDARSYYLDFKLTHEHELSRHYFKLSQKLMPMRVACAGGWIPLEDTDAKAEEDQDEELTKAKKKEPQKLSDFAFTSKAYKLVEELKRIRAEDSSAKSLVFSQFNSTLKWLKQELLKHGFQYRSLSGDMTMSKRAKALRDFQNDPPTTVFLLSMRAGAVGINLTQANRVFIMEPCFNPALEAQAIGRVHRLGQKRNVEIIRLIMKDSVESRMQKMLSKKYGNGKASSHEESYADYDGDKKPAAKPEVSALVGSIKSDKCQVMTDEFDLLFGIGGSKTESINSASSGVI